MQVATNQSLSLEQRLGLRLSQQQLRYVRLLELNTPELEDAVERELTDNPALEKEDKYDEKGEVLAGGTWREFAIRSSGSRDEDVDYVSLTADRSASLYDYLREQLYQRDLSEREFKVAEYVIDSLDRNGYLRRSVNSLADDLAFNEGDVETTPDDVRKAVDVVRSLEPFGVGATDLRECLEIQLRHKPDSEEKRDALRIVTEEFREFSLRHESKIMSRLKLSEERLRKAVALIRSLNPKPGASVGGDYADSANIIVPDFVVAPDEDGELVITVNNRIPELRIDETFSQAARTLKNKAEKRLESAEEEKNREFILSRYNDAREFIAILRRRQETLMTVMTAIVTIQKEYFETADLYRLRTMMLKDVSALTGLDFSVISRATANKHVATPWGIFPLRFFFSDSVSDSASRQDSADDTEGTDVLTNRKIEARIRELVEKEDKRRPLSDERLRELIEEEGHEVSRRTIAKYRDRIGIPVARLRKEL